MTPAEAKALLPALRLEANDPEANRRALETLAAWAQAFSPIVQIEGSDTLLLDVSGCERLFKGEHNLLDQALDGLQGRGFSGPGAVADTPGAAWAIAHAHDEWAVVTAAGRDVEELLRLPVGALRIEERTVAALHAVGVETIETLMYLPRASLSARFGDTLLHRLDQTLGNVPEPLVPFHPPPVLRSHLRLGAATDRLDIIHRAAEHVLIQFCEQLARKVVGVIRLHVTFYHPEASPTTFTIDVSRPTRAFKRLQGLLIMRLEQVHLPAETDGLMIWARHTEPLDDWQGELFETQVSDNHELADLVDRLSVRLGCQSVARAALVSDHQPERAYAYVPSLGTYEGGPVEPLAQGARPLRVWSRPMEVPVVALAPEGPPSMFRFQSIEHPIVACVGPERVETGWWRGPHLQRDYFRVVSRSGQAFWIFRDRRGGGWFVHGVFD